MASPRSLLSSVATDVRFGVRLLTRSPLFAIVAIVSLATGIAASSAIFEFSDALLFRNPPGASDIPVLRPLSQAGYRPLLEAGIRVFEWKGPMLHAKTAVADGSWARVGSSNLNVASWIGNYELDAVVENEAFAAQMEDMYLEDLENAREIVLEPRRRRHSDRDTSAREPVSVLRPRGSASRAAAGALRIGRTVTAALSEQRVLARTDARLVASSGLVLLAIAVIGVLWPLAVIAPLAIVLVWVALVLLARAFTLRRERRSQGLPPTRVRPASSQPPASP